jgi:hypothetical protein
MLPTQFQYTDPLPALGRKIVPQAAKKPDPIAAFEEGVHLLSGEVLPSLQQRQRERTSMAGALAKCVGGLEISELFCASMDGGWREAREELIVALNRARGEFDLIIDEELMFTVHGVKPGEIASTQQYQRMAEYVHGCIEDTPQAQRDRAMEKVMVSKAVEKLRLNLDWLKGGAKESLMADTRPLAERQAAFDKTSEILRRTIERYYPIYALSVRNPV